LTPPFDNSVSSFPPLLVNPALLKGIVRRKVGEITRRSPLFGRLPIDAQLNHQYLTGLRNEIDAAEPVLLNVYRDTDFLNIRESALLEITHILLVIHDSVEQVPMTPTQRDAVRADVEMFLGMMRKVVVEARYGNEPVLAPMPQLVPYAASGVRTNQADIVFVVSTAVSLNPEISMVSRGISAFTAELADRGVEANYGLQAFGRTSLPGGWLTPDTEALRAAFAALPMRNEPQNTLAAIADVPAHYRFRESAHPVIILVTDAEASDDWGENRADTLNLLREYGIILFALSVSHRYTGEPFSAYKSLAEDTGGGYFNFARTPWNVLLSDLALSITEAIAARGVSSIPALDRHLPVGPESNQTVTVCFPDFTPEALGLSDVHLETREDYVSALGRVRNAISHIVKDRSEKRVLSDYLQRIMHCFDDIREFKLDFHI
jgi:hypothetical protein